MTGLAEWLLEAITEDEADARLAMEGFRTGEWTLDGTIYAGHPESEVVDWVYHEAWGHIARHDPSRVLAECAAKRAIIELHADGRADLRYPGDDLDDEIAGMPAYCVRCEVDHQGERWPCETLRLLAAPYADRPGFLEEWRA
jgi:hypothetical protein